MAGLNGTSGALEQSATRSFARIQTLWTAKADIIFRDFLRLKTSYIALEFMESLLWCAIESISGDDDIVSEMQKVQHRLCMRLATES
jgi:hypothetical protein